MTVTIDDLLSIGDVQARNIEKGMACTGVSTDSRTIRQGELFFALRGELFDGHRFVDAAMARGALGAVIDRDAEPEAAATYPLFIVNDTTKALGRLAHVVRKKFRIPFIAVAGSNGKTTTKEMISSVLRTQYDVLSTEGNLNNHIGVPLTLLKLEQHHEKAVIEIGTNHFGELRYLCGILEPTHGLITNIGHEHMEFFKNLDGVAQAEGELFDALANSGTAYVNTDDRHLEKQATKPGTKVTYGFSRNEADVFGRIVDIDSEARASISVRSKNVPEFTVELAVPGKHMALNALAAATVGLSQGVEVRNIQKGLKEFTAVGKRMQIVNAGGVTIINDTYNANPDSVVSALESLAAMKTSGTKFVVLADMLELGDASAEEHRTIGAAVRALGFDRLLTFGSMGEEIVKGARVQHGIHFNDKQELSRYLASKLSAGDIVLVKGSRGMKMEEVVASVQNTMSGVKK